MKISDAMTSYRSTRRELVEQNRMLVQKRNAALKQYEHTGSPAFSEEAATLQLSIDATTEAFEKNQKVLDSLMDQYMAVWNTEVAKQQADACAEEFAELGKIMAVFRRLAKGDIVPQTDERKLMEYDEKMYQVAKNMQAMAQQLEKDRKKHESLWEEEEPRETYDPEGKAENAQVQGSLPEITVPQVAL